MIAMFVFHIPRKNQRKRERERERERGRERDPDKVDCLSADSASHGSSADSLGNQGRF